MDAPASADAFVEWHRQLTTRPPGDVRRMGRWMVLVGAGTALAAAPVSLALANGAFIAALAGALLAGAPLHRAPGFFWAAAFAGWCTLSSIAGWWRGGAFQLGNLLYAWLAWPLACAAFSDGTARRWAFRGLAVTLVVAALLALAQTLIGFDLSARPLRIGGGGPKFGHVSGFLGYHLTYGAVTVLALATATARHERGWAWAARIAAATGIVLSLARLALLGVAAAVVARLALLGGRWRLIAPVVAVALLGIGGLVLHAVRPAKFDDLVSGRDGRLAIWTVTAGMVVDAPMLGAGSAHDWKDEYARRWPEAVGWRDDLPNREPEVPHAHSSLLTIASLHGLPALALHVVFLLLLARAVRRRLTVDRDAGAAAGALIVAWLAAGLFNNLSGQGETAYAFYLQLGLLLAGGALSPPSTRPSLPGAAAQPLAP